MRRDVLVVLAIALALANAVYFAHKTSDASAGVPTKVSEASIEEIPAGWVAFMPVFEASQRVDPEVFGTHEPAPSELWPHVAIDGQLVSRLSMVAARCSIEHFAIRNQNDAKDYMPDRLFAQHLSQDQQDCLRANLPDSYQLSRLSEDVLPSSVSWSTDLSKLIVDGSDKAQVP